MKKYYEIVEYDNDKPFAYYSYGVNWIPKNIINDEEKDGYIVQKVNFINETGIDLNLEKSNKLEYYEAWKVKNQKVVKNENETFFCDDLFSYGNEYLIGDCIKESLGKNGEIKYFSQVYWISVNDSLYNVIQCWKEDTVKMANGLKSVYSNDCPELEKYVAVFKRDDFVHKVNFSEKNTVKKTIQEVFQPRIKNKDEIFYSYLKNEILENTEYISIIDEIRDVDLNY